MPTDSQVLNCCWHKIHGKEEIWEKGNRKNIIGFELYSYKNYNIIDHHLDVIKSGYSTILIDTVFATNCLYAHTFDCPKISEEFKTQISIALKKKNASGWHHTASCVVLLGKYYLTACCC